MIDLTKPIEFMDGTPARADNILTGICGSTYRVRVYTDMDNTYTDINGQIGGVQVIRNRPEPKKFAIEYWLNVYSNGLFATHGTKEHADRFASEDRIACVHRHTIVEEGFGL